MKRAILARLAVLWVYILANTVRGVVRGSLFVGKPLAEPGQP